MVYGERTTLREASDEPIATITCFGGKPAPQPAPSPPGHGTPMRLAVHPKDEARRVIASNSAPNKPRAGKKRTASVGQWACSGRGVTGLRRESC